MSELKEIRERILVNLKEVVGQNKEKVEDAYKRVMKLEHIARREGLLALECEAEFLPRDIPLCNDLIEMIELIVSGTEPEIFEELVTIKFFAVHDYKGIEALLYFLYARSMLMIQAATSPRVIEELFNAVLPNELLTFEQERMIWEEEKKHRLEKWIGGLTSEENELLHGMAKQLQGLSEEEWKTVISSNGFYGFDTILPYMDDATKALIKSYMNDYRYYVIMSSPRAVADQELIELNKELEEMIHRLRNRNIKGILDDILKCSDEEIQLLLRNIDINTLAVALKGVKEEVAECFLRNLSLRLRGIVQEDMEYMGPIRLSEVEDAQRKILKIAERSLDNSKLQ